MSFIKFPEFQKLSVADQSTYLHYYSKLDEPYSSFSFNNLLIWCNYYDDLEVSDLNGNLVIKFTNVLENDAVYYSLIGVLHLKQSLESLFDFLNKQSSQPKLSYIPAHVAEAIRQLHDTNIKIEEDIDNKDYVYAADNLASMRGRRYSNLRSRVNKFRNNKNIHTRLFDCTNNNDKETIKSAILEWSKRESFARNDPQKWELSVIEKHLQLAEHLSTHAYGLYVESRLACVIIFNLPPHKGWLIADHIKYDYDYPGIFGYAFYELAHIAQSKGIEWINSEQDLGKEGIRLMKSLLRPAKFLRCYTIMQIRR
jgi:hypothetical protein